MKGRIELKIVGATFSILIAMLLISVAIMVSWQRAEIYGQAGARLADLAEFTSSNFEREMLSGKVDAARLVSDQMSLFKDIESVKILNRDGREAFRPEASVTEAHSLGMLAARTESFTVRHDGRLVIYRPLLNRTQCRGCHAAAGNLLGAVRISVGLDRERARIVRFGWLIATGGVTGTLLLGLSLWIALRRIVVTPLKVLGVEAAKMADGDLSFDIALPGHDETVRLQDAIKGSLRSVSGILRLVSAVTERVTLAARKIEQDSGRVVASTHLEAKAIADISGSVEELNVSIKEIAASVEGLAGSVQGTSASMDGMAASIVSVGETVHDLTDGVETTSSSLEELSATFREVVGGAGELDRVSGEMLSAVERIIASISRVELKVKESARLAERVTEEASSIGVSATARTTGAMARIEGAVEGTALALEQLDSRSEEIVKIVTVIGAIADQTTLLALNAAILAAQIGEKGTGFAVVAAEMKDLARKTAGSTKEIAALIAAVRNEVKGSVASMHEALGAVHEGTALSGEIADSFAAILRNARSSTEMSLSIERTTGEQARIAALVSGSVGQVRAMARRVAQAISEQMDVINFIAQATEKIRDASLEVRLTSDRQTKTSAMISKAVGEISERSRQIAQAINTQKIGAGRICRAIEEIREIPTQSKDIAFGVNRTLHEVVKDVELIGFEMAGFKLCEEDGAVVKLGIVPVDSAAEAYRRYTPLALYLGTRLARRVELRVVPNFETALGELAAGVTSFCSLTSSIFIEAQQKFGARTLATVVRGGTSHHRAAVVVRAGGGVGSLQELKGRTFCFVDAKTATGYVLQRAMLLEAGIDLADLASYNFTAAHDEVARAVLRGEFDAGAMMESCAEKYREEGLVVLQVSDPVPDWSICCRDDAPLQAALQQALVDLDETTDEGRRVLHAIEPGCSGFVRSSVADHDSLRAMMARFGMLRPSAI